MLRMSDLRIALICRGARYRAIMPMVRAIVPMIGLARADDLRLGVDPMGLLVWRLDRDARGDSVEPLGEVPVGVAEHVHERRDEHRSEDEGVKEHRGGKSEAEDLDWSARRQRESEEDRDHDDRR